MVVLRSILPAFSICGHLRTSQSCLLLPACQGEWLSLIIQIKSMAKLLRVSISSSGSKDCTSMMIRHSQWPHPSKGRSWFPPHASPPFQRLRHPPRIHLGQPCSGCVCTTSSPVASLPFPLTMVQPWPHIAGQQGWHARLQQHSTAWAGSCVPRAPS